MSLLWGAAPHLHHHTARQTAAPAQRPTATYLDPLRPRSIRPLDLDALEPPFSLLLVCAKEVASEIVRVEIVSNMCDNARFVICKVARPHTGRT